MATTYNNYTQHILHPEEVFPYSEMIMMNYEHQNPGIISMTPFVGLKIRLTDLDAYKMGPPARITFLERNMRNILSGNGCMLRETRPVDSMDGLYLISLPVPIHQLDDYNCNQLSRFGEVLYLLDTQFNIVANPYFEINISGRCAVAETADRLSTIRIPNNYKDMFIPQESPYNAGRVIRINNNYMLLRTQWDMSKLGAFNYENFKNMVLDITPGLSTAFK